MYYSWCAPYIKGIIQVPDHPNSSLCHDDDTGWTCSYGHSKWVVRQNHPAGTQTGVTWVGNNQTKQWFQCSSCQSFQQNQASKIFRIFLPVMHIGNRMINFPNQGWRPSSANESITAQISHRKRVRIWSIGHSFLTKKQNSYVGPAALRTSWRTTGLLDSNWCRTIFKFLFLWNYIFNLLQTLTNVTTKSFLETRQPDSESEALSLNSLDASTLLFWVVSILYH